MLCLKICSTALTVVANNRWWGSATYSTHTLIYTDTKVEHAFKVVKASSSSFLCLPYYNSLLFRSSQIPIQQHFYSNKTAKLRVFAKEHFCWYVKRLFPNLRYGTVVLCILHTILLLLHLFICAKYTRALLTVCVTLELYNKVVVYNCYVFSVGSIWNFIKKFTEEADDQSVIHLGSVQ